MYYDTAMTSGTYALDSLNQFAGSARIVFGSDFPMAKVAPIVARNLDKHSGFSKEDLAKIYTQNCRQLIPGLS